ncbi:MAG: hypothetical protein AAF518_15400 [Spirochaetota bacterium]
MQVKCPYCFHKVHPKRGKYQIDPYRCSNCKRELDIDYVKSVSKNPFWQSLLDLIRLDANYFNTKRQIFVGMIGKSGHGKTVYITSLFFILKNLPNIWQEYYYRCLNEESIEKVEVFVKNFKNSELPEGTPVMFATPSILNFIKLPYFLDQVMCFYDAAGEMFENREQLAEQGKYVCNTDVVFCIVSLRGIGTDSNWCSEFNVLVSNYIGWVQPKQQNLVVVLTQGDCALDEIPEDVANYLLQGDIYQYQTIQPDKLERQLQGISEKLRSFLLDKGCANPVRLIEDRFKKVKYTIVSSTGQEPVEGKLLEDPTVTDPKRVLDPFFWSLLLNK